MSTVLWPYQPSFFIYIYIPYISILVAVQNSKKGHTTNPGPILTMLILANVCYNRYIYYTPSMYHFKKYGAILFSLEVAQPIHNKSYQTSVSRTREHIPINSLLKPRDPSTLKQFFLENCAWKHLWYGNCGTICQLCFIMSPVLRPTASPFLDPYCPACRTTLVATRFRVAVICPIIQVPHCIRVFFYFVWFVFINHIFQFYYELCTYCNILDIYLS